MLDRIRKVFFVVALILIVFALIVEKAFAFGFGLTGLSLVEGLLAFAIILGSIVNPVAGTDSRPPSGHSHAHCFHYHVDLCILLYHCFI